jgi:hypothetical protein
MYAHTRNPPLSQIVLKLRVFHRTGEDINVSYLLVSLTFITLTVPKISDLKKSEKLKTETNMGFIGTKYLYAHTSRFLE